VDGLVHAQRETPAPVDAQAPAAIVRLVSVRKAYRDVVAVDQVDLEIARGEFFTMLGPSGSGKTTTLRLIAGFEKPDRGTIELDGQDVTALPPFERNVNTVFQDYALFPHMTVAGNIAYGLESHGVPRPEIACGCRRRCGWCGSSRTASAGRHSSPVASASASAWRARSSTAPRCCCSTNRSVRSILKLRQEMQSELKRIQAEVGITFLYVTHDQEEALTMSDRIAIFNHGRIEQIGTPGAIYERPVNEFVASFVGTSNILERDGKRLLLRPEKIHLALPGAAFAETGLHVEEGHLLETVYVGMFTRYRVALTDGAAVTVVCQNLHRTASPLREPPGTTVSVGWRPDDLTELS
jgi:putative spermidine/putrescine transport system ATP-binding protein